MPRSFDTFELKVDTFEEQIQDLLDAVDLTSDKVKELNFDFSNLVRDLQKVEHSDDDFHIGEPVLEHMKMVLQNINRLTQGMDKKKRNMFRLLAFLHDVAKPDTFEMRDDKATFYGHPDRGFEVTKVLLEQFEEESSELREYVAKMVKYHHRLYELAHARKNLGNSKQLSYLKKFYDSGMATKETLEDLALFAQADSMTSTALEEAKKSAEAVMSDVQRYREQKLEEERRRKELERQIEQRAQNTGIVRQILTERSDLGSGAVEDALSLLPSTSEFNRFLGKREQYEAIKAVQKYLKSGER